MTDLFNPFDEKEPVVQRPREGALRAARLPKVEYASPNVFALPMQTRSVCDEPDLTTGLHLMLGPKASGKTLLSLSMAYDLLERGVKTSYNYVLEPRASDTRGLLNPDTWEDWYDVSCKALRGGVLVIDSMTYVIAMLAQLRDLGEYLSTVTYAGGLSPRDIQGALLHNEIAQSRGTCVIATVNSELFPVVDKFEGAVEGQISIRSSRSVSLRNRRTRLESTFSVSETAHNSAIADLGYTPLPSFSSENRI